MGVAQGMDIIMDLAEKLLSRKDIGFLFVGRGSDTARLKILAQSKQLDNAVFFDEIDPDEFRWVDDDEDESIEFRWGLEVMASFALSLSYVIIF
jgi:hypothetical protein